MNGPILATNDVEETPHGAAASTGASRVHVRDASPGVVGGVVLLHGPVTVGGGLPSNSVQLACRVSNVIGRNAIVDDTVKPPNKGHLGPATEADLFCTELYNGIF